VTARVWPDEERELARSFRVGTTGPDGLARVEGLAAGPHRVQLDRERDFENVEIRAGDEARLELAVQTLDLGTLRLETAGFLTVQLRREDGGPVDERLDLYLDTATERRVGDAIEIELGIVRFNPLAAGDYVLHALGAGCRDPRLPVRIEAGRTTELELVLRIGGWRLLRSPGQASGARGAHLQVVVRDGEGKVAFEVLDLEPFEGTLDFDLR
jgi:hypothetical protein